MHGVCGLRRRHWVEGDRASGSEATLALSGIQRLRRSVYFTPVASEQCPLPAADVAKPWTPARSQRPDLQTWLHRELQALLLEADVLIIAQHILGTMQSLMVPPPRYRLAPSNR